MKKLIFLLLASISMLANAADFNFRFNDTSTHVIYNEKEWEYVATEGGYTLSVARQKFSDDDVKELHTMVVFDGDGRTMENLGTVKRIFTYGLISCELSQFSLMVEFYTDKDNKILFGTTHEAGHYVASLAEKNTARNAVWVRVCSPSI